jgi:hypothetical protein
MSKEAELLAAGIRGPFHCVRCGEKLDPERMVWLELDQRTNTYTAGTVPQDRSQGSFTFGKACANRAEKEHANATLPGDQAHG